jgi:signal transduction histidine kinase
MKYAISILFIILNITSIAQNNNKLKWLNDSLKHELKKSRLDSVKAAIMLQLAENLLYNDPDSAIYYGEKALQLAERENTSQVKLGAMGFIGNSLINTGNLPKALELGFQAIEMAKDVPIRIAGIGPTIDNMGKIYYQIGDYEKAMRYFEDMVEMGSSDVVGVAFGYINKAFVFEKLNLLDSAMIYLNNSYQKFSTLDHSFFPAVYHVTPDWYNLRAKIYLKQNKPELALKDLFTTLQMTLQNDQAYHSSNTYNDISGFYKRFNQPDSTIYYAEKGLSEATRVSYSLGILNASEILAEQYESTDAVKALYFYKLASETRNGIYGAGNLQIIRDMIAQNENKQRELKAARIESRNRIRLNTLLGSLFTLFVVAILLFRNNRIKHKAKQKIESAFDQLKATQSQLIQSEKMASLGELTAGIAHEIQNPLNFVNNFSEVNKELAAELLEEIRKGNGKDAEAIIMDMIQNEEKILSHGQRADTIVKGMLQHSRANKGEKELTDLNTLCDEYLRLAYHGMRAKDKSFNAEYKLELNPDLPKVNVVPQDIGRVLLNLINNAFQAVVEVENPTVTLITQQLNNSINIRVADNGPGIPDNIRDKIFQPFFTTKPAGQGTGLGLSLSYDIISKGHGGSIQVESTIGKGSTFIIRIPAG